MGCGSSSAVDVTKRDESGSQETTPIAQPSAASAERSVREEPGSPQSVAAAARQLRTEVEAQSMAEKKRLQSSERSEQQEAIAEKRLKEMEEALAQLLSLIDAPNTGEDKAAFDVHVPPPGGPIAPDDSAAIARNIAAPAALPVALSDHDAAELKAALARFDDADVPAAADQGALAQASENATSNTRPPSDSDSGLTRTISTQSTQSTQSIQSTQSDDTICSSDFGSLDPDVVSSSSLLRLNGILKRLDVLELQAAFDANGGDAWQDEYDES